MIKVKEQKQKFYVVWKGEKPGIYTSWSDCKKQVDGIKNAHYKSFESQEIAKIAISMTYKKFKSLQEFMTKAGLAVIHNFNINN